jgi:hypothetical protein
MILLAVVSAVLAAAFAAKAAFLTDRLRAARLELAASRRRPAEPPPPPPPSNPSRQFECRLERGGLLWFPVLTARDEEKAVVGVSSGLPHCVRCVLPLRLAPFPAEDWSCAGCGERHPGRAADLMATDAVLTECLREFFARHPDFSPAPGLSAPRPEAAAA